MQAHAHAPGLTAEDMTYFEGLRAAGRTDLHDDPDFAPLSARDLSQMPATVAFAAECDPLASDAQAFVTRLQAAGVPALHRCEAGLVHGYLRARRDVTKAGKSFDRMVLSLRTLSGGALPDF
jgi:acetyl esterase